MFSVFDLEFRINLSKGLGFTQGFRIYDLGFSVLPMTLTYFFKKNIYL